MITLISDISFLLFALYVYLMAFELKQNTRVYKGLVFGSFALMIIAYALTVYAFDLLSPGIALLLCVTLPSFLVLSVTAKHRDARFVISFCFIDTAMIIIAVIHRLFIHVGGTLGGTVALVSVLTLGGFLVTIGRPCIKRYNELMDTLRSGWGISTACMISIYVALLFISQYPSPISERPEYFPVFIIVAAMCVFFYVFFIISVIYRSRMYETTSKLRAEREWHHKAYVDAVTGVKNRMAYVKRINERERTLDEKTPYFAVMIDVNSFKAINDTLGHHKGDEILCHLANLLTSLFPRDHYEIFRIGGDEFAIIGSGLEEYDVDGRISAINVSVEASRMGYSVAAGRSTVNYGENQAFEKAFIRADEAMYEAKRIIKEKQNKSN